ncbi:MAG: transcriptional regulator, AraC family [Devosia sp.]|nr:transcriptional regulator, AraC family [Devosia sp.]
MNVVLYLSQTQELQYQKHIRLQEARRRLVSKEADAASISFAVGYRSTSQFSREYKRLFGEPPRRDANTVQTMVELPRNKRRGVWFFPCFRTVLGVCFLRSKSEAASPFPPHRGRSSLRSVQRFEAHQYLGETAGLAIPACQRSWSVGKTDSRADDQVTSLRMLRQPGNNIVEIRTHGIA